MSDVKLLTREELCETCGGSGALKVKMRHPGALHGVRNMTKPCPDCHGTGRAHRNADDALRSLGSKP